MGKHINLVNDKVEKKNENPLKACGWWSDDICGRDTAGCGNWSNDCCIVDGGECGWGSTDCTDSNG